MNYKQLLADFYLSLLTIPAHSSFRLDNQLLYATTRDALATELFETPEAVQRIFERMAQEDQQ
jgi:hypothetical protein